MFILMYFLALPRGLRQFRKLNHLKKSGTPDRSTQSLCFLPRVSHQRDNQVLTFRQWTALKGISARTGRRILSAPSAPIVTRLSARRIGITVVNNRTWQASRERVS